MVKIRIIKDYVSGKKGDIKNWDKDGAKNAVEQGIAEYVTQEKQELIQDSTNKKLLDSIRKEYFFDCEERFEITHTYIKDGEKQYSKWKKYPTEVSNNEVLKADNRTISPNEIVLDIDQETKEEANKEYNKIIKKLKKDGYSFKGYFSGSKGFHIHLIFSDLKEYNDYDRKRIKEFFIKKYDCDLMKSTNRCMIALENTPHWKTGNKKTLMLEEGNYQNTIIPVLETMRFKPTIEKTEPITDKERKLNKFIFDESQVQKSKEFVFLKFNNIAGFGLFLPKEKEEYDKDGNFLGIKQVQAPVIIGSDKEIYEIGEEFQNKHKIKIETIPDSNNYTRWSLDSIHTFLKDETLIIEREEILNEIVENYKKYIYFSHNLWYKIQALWDIGTYFFMLFKYYPLMELRGLKGTAKSKLMTLSRLVTFNSTEEMTNPSEATLFRETHDKRPTKYIDEAEKLYFFNPKTNKTESDPRAELINSGYKYTGSVPRQEKIGTKFRTIYYKTYSPTMLASINGLYGATEDRAIIHIMTKPFKNDNRGNLDPDEEDIKYQELRNKLYIFALQEWETIENLYKNFNNEVKIKNRDLQIWKPLFVLAKFFDDFLFEQVKEFAEDLTEIKNVDSISEGSFEHKIITIIDMLLKEKKVCIENRDIVLIKEIQDKWSNDDYVPNPKTIARWVDKIGFRDFKEHTREGTAYRINEENFQNIIFTIFPSFHSFASQDNTIIDDKVTHSDVKERDGNEGNVFSLRKSCDGNEANEANEANFEMDGVISLIPSNDIITIESLQNKTNLDSKRFDNIIKKLKNEGEIYEPKKGSLQRL